MSLVFVCINTIIGIFFLYLVFTNVRKLFTFVEHPQQADVFFAEGMSGALHHRPVNSRGWAHTSSIVRLRVATPSKHTGTVLRNTEVIGGTDKPFFGKTGDPIFDSTFTLFKPTARLQHTFQVNLELRTRVYDYLLHNDQVLQLSFVPGFIEVTLINTGERVSDSFDRLAQVTDHHINQVKAIRSVTALT